MLKVQNFFFTCVANTRSSPMAKRATKPYKLFKVNAVKQHVAPINVAPDKSLKAFGIVEVT